MATTRNLSIDQGATYTEAHTLTVAVDEPWDLTGSTLRAQIRRTYADVGVLAAFACDLTDAAAGAYSLTLTAEQTSALPTTRKRDGTHPTLWVWDLELVHPDGETVERLLEGTVQVNPEVTRDA